MSEGYRVSNLISAWIYSIQYSCNVIAGMRANKMIIMERMKGDCSSKKLLRRLSTDVGDNDLWLNSLNVV